MNWYYIWWLSGRNIRHHVNWKLFMLIRRTFLWKKQLLESTTGEASMLLPMNGNWQTRQRIADLYWNSKEIWFDVLVWNQLRTNTETKFEQKVYQNEQKQRHLQTFGSFSSIEQWLSSLKRYQFYRNNVQTFKIS